MNDAYAQCCNNHKKLAYSGDTLALATTVKLNDAAGKGFIVTYLSADGGATWNSAVLNSSLTFMKDTIRYEPDTENDASAPSIAWSGSAFHLVWQEKRADSSYLVRTAALRGPVNTLDTVSSAFPGPLPVIGRGYDDILKIYYSCDSGMIEMTSEDDGLTWPDSLKTEVSAGADLHGRLLVEGYSGTSSISVRPAFTASTTKEILVWQEAQSDSNSVLFARAKDQSSMGIHRVSDYAVDTVRNLHNPHLSVEGEFIHLACIGMKNEFTGIRPEIHHKTVHMLLDFGSPSPTNNVKTFFNRKYRNRAESSVDPVVAGSPSASGSAPDMSAYVMWSVNDSIYEGARLRHNILCKRDTGFGWGKDMEIPGFSVFNTRSPQLQCVDGTVAFITTVGDSTPYHLRSSGADRLRWDPGLPEYMEFEYYVSDEIDRRILSSFVLKTPVLTDSLMAQYMVTISGPSLTGYDGSPGGMQLREITRTQSFCFRSSDFVQWQVDFRQSPVFEARDTVFLRGILLDSASSQEIGSSGVFRVLPSCNDTSLTLGFELPPSHYPERKTYLALDAHGGAIDLPARRLSTIINIFSEDGPAKCRARRVSETHQPARTNVSLYPQPAGEYVILQAGGMESEIFFVRLYDAMGRKLHESSQVASDECIFRLRTDSYMSGIYYYVLSAGANIRYGSFIVAK